MTELPEEVRRELEGLYGAQDVPPHAVTIQQLVDAQGYSESVWRRRMRDLVAEGKWQRGRQAGYQGYYYWPVMDEGLQNK
jgi:hypothetical protein